MEIYVKYIWFYVIEKCYSEGSGRQHILLPYNGLNSNVDLLVSEIRTDIRNLKCTTGVRDTGGILTSHVADIGDKFIAGVDASATFFPTFIYRSYTDGKFATGINTGGHNTIRLPTP